MFGYLYDLYYTLLELATPILDGSALGSKVRDSLPILHDMHVSLLMSNFHMLRDHVSLLFLEDSNEANRARSVHYTAPTIRMIEKDENFHFLKKLLSKFIGIPKKKSSVGVTFSVDSVSVVSLEKLEKCLGLLRNDKYALRVREIYSLHNDNVRNNSNGLSGELAHDNDNLLSFLEYLFVTFFNLSYALKKQSQLARVIYYLSFLEFGHLQKLWGCNDTVFRELLTISVQKFLKLPERNSLRNYNLACLYSLMGDIEKSRKWLVQWRDDNLSPSGNARNGNEVSRLKFLRDLDLEFVRRYSDERDVEECARLGDSPFGAMNEPEPCGPWWSEFAISAMHSGVTEVGHWDCFLNECNYYDWSFLLLGSLSHVVDPGKIFPNSPDGLR